MSHTSRTRKAQTIAAAAALCAGGLLRRRPQHTPRIARSTVTSLHISSGGIYSITVNANGSTLGPRAVLPHPRRRPLRERERQYRGIRAVNFIVDWDEWTTRKQGENRRRRSETTSRGDIGADGIASGTSVGSEIPGNLYKPGEWHTTDKLNCEGLGGGAAAGGGPTINEDVRLFDKPNGNDLGVDLKKGDSVTLNGPVPDRQRQQRRRRQRLVCGDRYHPQPLGCGLGRIHHQVTRAARDRASRVASVAG